MSKQSDLVVISQIGVPAPFNPQTTAIGPGDAVTTTYAVTVASSGGANRYFIDGVAYPKLTLSRTYIYIFDLSNSSNSGHPLRFKDAAGSSYSTGVVVTGTPGQAGAKVTLTVAANAPVALSYYCTVHGNAMGNTIAVTNSASLNVGANNYFDSGTLAANTSVNFASVPTTAKWQYSYKVGIASGTWDISTAVFLQSKDTSNYGTDDQGLFFKPDGTKMYTVGKQYDDVNEYDLSIAWDVTTAVYLQQFSVAPQETSPSDLTFSPDGTKMYTTGRVNQDVDEYTLSTAWNVTTASFVHAFSAASQDTDITGIHFKTDGYKMYIVGYTGDDVNEYNLSTAWNISTASYLRNFDLSSQEISVEGIFFKEDGLKMFIVGSTGDEVNEYALSTAWNVTTASFTRLFSVSPQDSAPSGIFINPDGTDMYIVGNTSNKVYQYTLGSNAVVTLPAAVVGNTSTPSLGNRVTYTFVTVNSGSTVNLIGEEIF